MPKLPPTLKRLLSIAFFASLVYFGAKIFTVETADCEIVFRLRGAEMKTLQELEVRLYDGDDDEPLGEFRQYFQHGSTAPLGRWPLVISEGKYRLECELRSKDGDFSVTLPVELVDGEAISVYIDRPKLSPRD